MGPNQRGQAVPKVECDNIMRYIVKKKKNSTGISEQGDISTCLVGSRKMGSKREGHWGAGCPWLGLGQVQATMLPASHPIHTSVNSSFTQQSSLSCFQAPSVSCQDPDWCRWPDVSPHSFRQATPSPGCPIPGGLTQPLLAVESSRVGHPRVGLAFASVCHQHQGKAHR